jgi:hypothetical protein
MKATNIDLDSLAPSHLDLRITDPDGSAHEYRIDIHIGC